jgi:hypothetical protein
MLMTKNGWSALLPDISLLAKALLMRKAGHSVAMK